MPLGKEILLELVGIKFKYPSEKRKDKHEWLLNVDYFSIEKNWAISLLGGNMIGKSTLIKLITGTLPPISFNCYVGSIKVDGIEYKLPVNPLKMKKLGIVAAHQSDQMFPELSIWENIELGCPYFRVNNSLKKSKRDIVVDKLKKFELLNSISIDSPLGELSGGAIAIIKLLRSTIWNYKLLILDETTANIDNNNRKVCFQLLSEMLFENSSVLLISHTNNDHLKFREISNDKYVYKIFTINNNNVIPETIDYLANRGVNTV